MVAAMTPPPPPGVASKDQRKLKQGLGVQNSAQTTTDLERQSHTAASVGKQGKLGKLSGGAGWSRAMSSSFSHHIRTLLAPAAQSCRKASVPRLGYYSLMSRPCALFYCYG
jgi:hypothetical protein